MNYGEVDMFFCMNILFGYVVFLFYNVYEIFLGIFLCVILFKMLVFVLVLCSFEEILKFFIF